MLRQSWKNHIENIQGAYGYSMSISYALLNAQPYTPSIDLRADYGTKGEIGFTGAVQRKWPYCMT